MVLVAGIDSSTQTCKVTVRDIATGTVVREGRAPHPPETIVDPELWWGALLLAVRRAGGLDDVAAVAVFGQQHTPVLLNHSGAVVRNSPLWNDTDSHPQMLALNAELGRDEWIRRTGLPLTLSDTVAKLRWVRDVDPDAADRTDAVAMIHDWLTWRLRGFGPGSGGIDELTTDRSDACGTGYWSPERNEYLPDLLEHAFGRSVVLPRILAPLDIAGFTGAGIPGIPAGIPIAAGGGDNGAAALALGQAEGDTVVSLGTSGVVYARSATPVHDYAGYVCNYADATGDHQPLVASMNAARNLDVGTTLLGCSYEELSELALSAPPGAEGLTVLPFFLGERTPDLPDARGSVHNATLTNFTRENFARALVEATVASQVAMVEALGAISVATDRLLLIGGAAQSPALQAILNELVEVPVLVPAPDEYVAKGAAMQAAGALSGTFPAWHVEVTHLPAARTERVAMEQRDAAMASLGYDTEMRERAHLRPVI